MKKLLALVLALVMSMSLVTISNAAFKDADKISNKEAVDVMAAVGVLAGYDNGEFGATDTLTRAQACKIIAYLDLGKDVAEALPAVQVFSDLSANNWAAKYVAYCADAGYVSGVGDKKFAPDEKVTGYQFGKMLLCALGYDQKVEEMTGSSWEIKVAKLMEKNSLSKGTSKLGSAALTREEAAQYGLNALKATCVEYDEKGSTIIAGDVTIINGAKKAKAVESAEDYSKVIDETVGSTTSVWTVQLGEKLYKGDLTLAATGAATSDDFGRPVKTWEYKNAEVATSVTSAKAVFTADTKADDVVKALKGYKFNGTELKDKDTQIGSTTTAIDSLTFSAATDKIAEKVANLTANGKVVEFYADSNKNINKIVVIEYTFDKVANVSTNNKGKTTYTINSSEYFTGDANKDDTAVLAGKVEKNDYVTYVIANSKCYIYPTTNFDGKMTKYNRSDATITVAGTTYKTSAATVSALTAASSFDGTANSKFYVDQYGFVVAVDGINDTQYAVIDSIAYVNASGVEGKGYAEARLVFVDGKTEVVRVKTIDGKTPVTALSGNATEQAKQIVVSATATANSALAGEIYKYSINDGKYVLTKDTTATKDSVTFAKGNPTIATGAYANNSTTYVVKTKDGDDNVWTVYTGFKTMPTSAAATTTDYAKNSDGDVVFVYVDATATSVGDTTSDVVFFFNNEYTVDKSDENNTYYEYTAILNGELKTVVATADLSASTNTLYKATLNDKGQVTAIAAATGAKYYQVQANGTAKGGVLGIDSAAINGVVSAATYVTYGDDTTVYFVHTDSKTVNTGSIESVKDNATLYVKTVENDSTAKGYTVSVAYVLVND